MAVTFKTSELNGVSLDVAVARALGLSFEYGPTPLIAAMRCFVASKLGDTVTFNITE